MKKKKGKPRYMVGQRCGKNKGFPSLSDARAYAKKVTTIYNLGDVYIIKKEAGKRDVVVY